MHSCWFHEIFIFALTGHSRCLGFFFCEIPNQNYFIMQENVTCASVAADTIEESF